MITLGTEFHNAMSPIEVSATFTRLVIEDSFEVLAHPAVDTASAENLKGLEKMANDKAILSLEVEACYRRGDTGHGWLEMRGNKKRKY